MAKNADIGQPVREFYRALNEQKLDLFDRIISENIEFIDFGLDEAVNGRAEFKDYFQNWWLAFPSGTGEIRNMVVTNDQVVVEVYGRGNQLGQFKSNRGIIAPTNRVFDFHFCQIFRVKDGRIISGHSYSDAYKLLELAEGMRKAA